MNSEKGQSMNCYNKGKRVKEREHARERKRNTNLDTYKRDDKSKKERQQWI